MRRAIFVFAIFYILSPPAFAAGEADALRAVLLRQQTDWNRGDIDSFMTGYWKSPKLRFVSGGKIVSGWADTLARYKARYASRAQMGVLHFSDLDVTLLAPDAALAVGHWRLQRKTDAPGGAFSLIFRRLDGRWVIVLDHTS